MTKALTQCDYPDCRSQRKPGARFCEAHLDLSVKAQEDYNALVNEMLASMMSEPEHEDPRPDPPEERSDIYQPRAQITRWNRGYFRHAGARIGVTSVGAQPHYTQRRWDRVRTATIGAAEVPAHEEAQVICTSGYDPEAFLLRFRVYLPQAREPFDYEGVTLKSVQLMGCDYLYNVEPGTPASHFIRMRSLGEAPRFGHVHGREMQFFLGNKTDEPITVAIVGELGFAQDWRGWG